MNFSADIAEAKAELAQLNSALTTATGEREIAIRNQITAKENQLTTLTIFRPQEVKLYLILISNYISIFDAAFLTFLALADLLIGCRQ